MYHNVYANFLHYIFEWEPMKKQKHYPDVGLLRQNIYAEQSHQQYFLLFGTEIYFVVKH